MQGADFITGEAFAFKQGPDSSKEDQVYTVSDIARMLKISSRKAYNMCDEEKDWKVLRIGRCIRVKKESFDNWFKNL